MKAVKWILRIAGVLLGAAILGFSGWLFVQLGQFLGLIK